MANAITNRSQARLPGLLPNEDALTLAQSFQIIREGEQVIIDRLPTPAERDILDNRRRELSEALRPAQMAGADRAKASDAILSMLLGYSANKGQGGADALVAAYLTHLESLPLFAIEAACRDVVENKIVMPDGSKPNLEWAPSSPVLFHAAEQHTKRKLAERATFDAVLTTKHALPPPLTDEERAARAEQFKATAEKYRLKVKEDDLAKREPALKAAAEERDRMVGREWEAIGFEPYRGPKGIGALVSPSLYRLLKKQWPPPGAVRIPGFKEQRR